MSVTRGVFITFEGSEGCGKSTQIERLVGRLRERGVDVVLTREPGGTALGEAIRHLLKYAPEGRGMTAEAELLLFTASRAELVRKVIEPALAEGRWVVADRFMDSTTVYQGVARRLHADAVRMVNDFAVGARRPDLTLVLDLPLVEAGRRIALRAKPEDAVDRMEEMPGDFYVAVREGYLALARNEPARVRVIDAAGSADEVEAAVWGLVAGLVGGAP